MRTMSGSANRDEMVCTCALAYVCVYLCVDECDRVMREGVLIRWHLSRDLGEESMSLRISNCGELQRERTASAKIQVRKRRPVWLKWPEQEEGE